MQELLPHSLAGRAEALGGSYLAFSQPGSPWALEETIPATSSVSNYCELN